MKSSGIAGPVVVCLSFFSLFAVPEVTSGAVLRVRIQNLAPTNGIFLTPTWVGFHDGTFDLYDMGSAASSSLESLAEDGNAGPLSMDFQTSGAEVVDGMVFGPTIPPIGPGETSVKDFVVDESSATSRYFSYAAMVIPSNDAFVANDDPLAHQLFDSAGQFLGVDLIVLGTSVLDAGTEDNDELPMNTAFFGQASPNTGVTTAGGTVELHPGFLTPGSGGILDAIQFADADFLASGYQVVRISVTAVPEPTSIAMFALGSLCLVAGARRRRSRVGS